ncbi:MAG: DNA repair protein RecN [Oscillospiraceae bacterium]|nr:DNA repair protein RecN [Oscillospiraceae bacterium]
MLQSLFIENVAVIEKTEITFGSGFNVLTGETGAGKSILIDSINAVLGQRTSRELVRTGAAKARVTAVFSDFSSETIEKISDLGFEPDEDGTLIISREITADGKGSCRVSGMPASVATLRELGGILVNVHGQHDNQALLNPSRHCGIIDAYAGLSSELAGYHERYRRCMAIRKELSELSLDSEEKARRIDMLTYQTKEIEAAQIVPGEEETLRAELNILENAAAIAENSAYACDRLMGGEDSDGAVALLKEAASAVAELSDYIEGAAELAERLTGAACEAEDAADEIRSLFDEDSADTRRIDMIEERLDLFYRLKKKYGSDLEAVLQFYDKACEELNRISFSEEKQQELTALLASEENLLWKAAEELSRKREEAARRFTQGVCGELAYLDMPNVRIEAANQKGEPGPNGIDNIELMISANVGEPPKPLSKIASGGELSRIMLAMKSIMADTDQVATLIFDEIDTGVSGRAAQKIGVKLKGISGGRQILCVTHLAQIAAGADVHLLIAKEIRNERTYTTVSPLDRSGRVNELARIIGGDHITPLMLQNAEEMLDFASGKE